MAKVLNPQVLKLESLKTMALKQEAIMPLANGQDAIKPQPPHGIGSQGFQARGKKQQLPHSAHRFLQLDINSSQHPPQA